MNGTNADVEYLMGLRFDKSSEQYLIRDRRFTPSQLKCLVSNGTLPYCISTGRVTNVSAINTGVSLDSPRGSATVVPAVGDIIIEYNRTAGTYNAAVSCFYHSH